MKKSIFKKIGGLFLGLTMGLGVAVGVAAGKKASEVRGEDTVFYTNSCPKNGSNSDYTKYYDATVNGIKWKAPGNQYDNNNWRIGGKNLTSVNRYLYTQDAIETNVSSVIITYGGASSVTINSSKLDVYSTAELAAAGGNGDISSISNIVSLNSTKEISRPSGADWTDRFYRFTYNVTIGKNNKYIDLQKIEFFKSNDDPEADTYTINFAPGIGSSGSKESKTVDILKSYTVPNYDGFTVPTGKVFDKWSGSDGETYTIGSTIEGSTFVKDYVLTLTALWKDIPGEPADFTKITSFYNASEKMSGATFKYSGETTNGISGYKGGTGDVTNNSIQVKVPTGTTELVIYCAGWKDKAAYLEIDSAYTDDGKKSLQNDSGMASSSPFTLSEPSLYTDKYKVHFDLININSETTLTLSFSGERVGFWYVGYKQGQVPQLTGIEITKAPTKVEYVEGEKFNPAGLVINALYDIGNPVEISYTDHSGDFTFTPSLTTSLTTTNTSVQITYGGKNATQNITVTAAKTISSLVISGTLNKTEYYVGNSIETAGLVVTANYSDGGSDDVTSSSTFNCTPNIVAANTTSVTITASYLGTTSESTTIDITVTSEPGTEANPYSITQVYNIASNLTSGANTGSNSVAKGYVLFSKYDSEKGRYSFALGDVFREATSEKDLRENEVQGYSINEIKDSEYVIKTGDIVTLQGYIIRYKNTPSDIMEIGFATGATAKVLSVNKLTGINVSGTPTYSTQYEGKSLKTDGLSFELAHESANTLTKSVNSSDIEWNTTVANQTPSGTYVDQTVTISSINIISDTLVSIKIVGNLTKSVYSSGDNWDYSGLSVEAEWGSNEGIYETFGAENYEFTCNFEKAAVGITEIRITATVKNSSISSYEDYAVTVNKAYQPQYLIYKPITASSDLSINDVIIIIDSDVTVALSSTQNDNNRGQQAITAKEDGSIEYVDGIQALTLKQGSVDGTFALYTGSGYLSAASSSSNHLKTFSTIDGNSSWELTPSSITAKGSYSRKVMQYNSGSSIFSCYGSATLKEVAIYKGYSIESIDATLNANGDIVESSYGTASYSFKDQNDNPITCAATFTSSDSSILEINSETGAWVAKKSGNVTVTVTGTQLSGDGSTLRKEINVTVGAATVEDIQLLGIHETQYLYDIGKCSFYAVNQNYDEYSPEVEYSSDNDNVITIDSVTGDWRAIKSGTATITVTSKIESSESTFVSDSITVTVSTAKPDHGYVLVSSIDEIYDGDIVLIGAKGADKIVSGNNNAALTNNAAEFIQMTSSGSYMAVANAYTEFEVRRVNTSFGFISSNGSMVANGNDIKFQEEESLKWSISISSGTATLKYDGSSNSLRCNSANDQMKLYSSGTTIQLYKKSVGSAMQIAQKYNSYITSACDTEGTKTDTEKLQNAWKVTSIAFKMMPAEEKAALLKGENDTFRNMLSSYEYIYTKYGASLNLEDFLASGLTSGAKINNPIASLNNVDNSVWVISAVALVGLTAIGGYFFYRKRKEI